MKTLIGIIIVLVVLGGGYYFATQSSSENGETMIEENQENDVVTGEDGDAMEDGNATMDDGSIKEFTVEGGNFYLSPNTMTVNKGDTVKITFMNAGGFHDFVIDEFNVATRQTNSGETATVEFVADQTGSFEYYCSVGNHRAQGMVGTLTVQ